MKDIYECISCGIVGKLEDLYVADTETELLCGECGGELCVQEELRELESKVESTLKPKYGMEEALKDQDEF